jgi:hypothetical protein
MSSKCPVGVDRCGCQDGVCVLWAYESKLRGRGGMVRECQHSASDTPDALRTGTEGSRTTIRCQQGRWSGCRAGEVGGMAVGATSGVHRGRLV